MPGQPTILATSGGYRAHDRLHFGLGDLIPYAVELSGAHGRTGLIRHQRGTQSRPELQSGGR